jgi:hypothetical protein
MINKQRNKMLIILYQLFRDGGYNLGLEGIGLYNYELLANRRQ